MNTQRIFRLTGLAVALAVTVSACSRKQPTDNANVVIRGTNPANAPAAPLPPGGSETPTVVIDANGIATYEGYQAAVARDGDTVASIASRVGLSGAELGAYNGLAPDHPLRGGDELVLPPRPGGYGTQLAQGTAPLGGGTAAAGTSGIEQSGLDGFGTGGQPAEANASANDAWSPDLAAAAIERSTGLDENGSLTAPPSSSDPLPEAPAPARTLESPNLQQYQTPEAGQTETVVGTLATDPEPQGSLPVDAETIAPAPTPEPEVAAAATPAPAALPQGFSLARPASGPIVIGYNQGAGPNRNDGIDFASPAGSTVHAAEAGEVALVSQALGGLGTIILVRHANDLLTVYGRLGSVNVAKGDIVERGQQIGKVATPDDGSEARMHFEVRRGAESVDPTQFF